MKRFENYAAALRVLADAPEQDLSNEFIQSGIINRFFLQFELGWKLLKRLLAYEGDPVATSGSPRDILKASFRYYGFMDEEAWLSMLRDRNNTAHVYDGANARRLVDTVISRYIPEFQRMQRELEELYGSLLTEEDGTVR